MSLENIEKEDFELFEYINEEKKRQDTNIELIREIYYNESFYIELDKAKEFVNNLKKILPSEDICIIKIVYYFFIILSNNIIKF